MPIRWPPAAAADLVDRLYMTVFDRAGDEPHRSRLAAAFANGELSVRYQLTRMFKSDEFFEKYLSGCSAEQISAALYVRILRRPPENSETLQRTARFIEGCGWQVRVDTLLNSEEYWSRFGDDQVPE